MLVEAIFGLRTNLASIRELWLFGQVTRGMFHRILNFLCNYCTELKREATARTEIRDKVKEEQSASVTEEKGPAEREHSETPPQITDNNKQGQWSIHWYTNHSE